MAVVLQVLGMLLGLAGWCLQSSCTSSQLWRVRTQADTVTSSQRLFEGLWMTCAASSLGSVQCSRFKTVLGLPVHIQVCRGLMVLSMLLSFASMLVTILGLKCTTIGRTSQQTKGKLILAGGILLILSGLMTLVGVSWYAGRVVQEFYDPYYSRARFELGTGLYLGWAASGLAVVGGSMLCCSCRTVDPGAPNGHFSYKYSSSAPGQRIYRLPPVSDAIAAKAYV